MTEKRNASCVIVEDLPGKAPAGHTMFHRNAGDTIIGLTFGCPCGCGSHHGGRFTGPNPWGFDGNTQKPTVRGSFGCYPSHGSPVGPDGKYHWHGHLKAGVFEEC
jgi:hypothetical protein